MTKKELKVVWNALVNAKNVIEELCTENYPYTGFNDPDFHEMFYDLNSMCIKVSEKRNALGNP